MKERVFRLGRKLLILVIVAVLLGWLYTTYLAPEDQVLIRRNATTQAREHIEQGELAEALQAIQTGLEGLPDDWELLTWQSVLQHKLGQSSADASLEQALAAGSEWDVRIEQGMVASLVEEPNLALEAGRWLIESEPDLPHGYFIMAQSYEMLTQLDDALENYRATEMRAQENPEHHSLYVAARERIFVLTTLPR